MNLPTIISDPFTYQDDLKLDESVLFHWWETKKPHQIIIKPATEIDIFSVPIDLLNILFNHFLSASQHHYRLKTKLTIMMMEFIKSRSESFDNIKIILDK
jgi:protein gp37